MRFCSISPNHIVAIVRQERVAKVRTAPQLYVRHLMMEKLKDDADVVEAVIKQLRKLPWQVGLPHGNDDRAALPLAS